MRPETTLRIGISTCPNDTHAFHGLLAGEIRVPGRSLEFELADVQALNETLETGRFDLVKASFAAFLEWSDRWILLPVGAALGRGNGPLLLAREPGRRPGVDDVVLLPGPATTATLLYRHFHPGRGRPSQMRFDRIMPALEAGEAEFGVCIHEGRFTYAERGLSLVEDLGVLWEAETRSPLPLGGILARADLDPETTASATRAIRESIALADRRPAEAMATMRRHAQELSDPVIRAHVDLYVNDFTRDLGVEGRRAVERLAACARRAGLASRPPVRVFDHDGRRVIELRDDDGRGPSLGP